MTEMTTCSGCEKKISADAKFCMHCGTKLGITEGASGNPFNSGSWGEADDLDLTDEESDYWEDKAGNETMQTVGWFLKAIKMKVPGLACSVGKSYLSIVPAGDSRRTDFIFYPQKKAIVFAARVPASESLDNVFSNAGATLMAFDDVARRSRYSVPIAVVKDVEGLLISLLKEAFDMDPLVSRKGASLTEADAKSAVRAIGQELGRDVVRGELKSIMLPPSPPTPKKPPKNKEQAVLARLVACLVAWAKSTGAQDPRPKIEEGSASFPFKLSSDEGEYQCFLDVQVEPLGYAIYAYTEIQLDDDQAASLEAWLADENEGEDSELELVGEDHRLRGVIAVPLDKPEFSAKQASDKLDQVIARLNKGISNIPGILSGMTGQSEAGAGEEKSMKPKGKGEGTTTTKQNEGKPMRLTEAVQQWLKEQEWEEQPEIDEENQSSSTNFSYSIGDFSLNCYFEASEKGQLFKLFMYFLESKVPEKRFNEVRDLVYLANNDFLVMGQLNLVEEKRVIRYFNAIDVENAAFEPGHITNMLNAGISGMQKILPAFMTVCFGDKTAHEAMADDES